MTCTHRSHNRIPCTDAWERSGASLDCVEQEATTAVWLALVCYLSGASSGICEAELSGGASGASGAEREWEKQWFPKRERNSVQWCGDLCGGEREAKREGGEIALLYQLCPQIQIPNVLIPKRIRELKPNPLVFAQICLKRTEILFFENLQECLSSEEGRLCRGPGWGLQRHDHTVKISNVDSSPKANDWKVKSQKYHSTKVI